MRSLLKPTTARREACWLLLAVVTLRSLVPAGFMPGVGAGDSLTMTMCGTDGPRVVAVHLAGHSGPAPVAPHSSHADAYCPYAAASTSAPPPAILVAPFLAPRAEDAQEVPTLPFVTSAFKRAHSPRAPPALV